MLEQKDPQAYARRQIEKAHQKVAGGGAANDIPILHREDPLRSAREFIRRYRPTLMHYNDDWLVYDGAAYPEIEQATVHAELYDFLEHAITPGGKNEPPVHFKPTKAKVANVDDALKARTHKPREIYEPPCWVDCEGPPADEIIACRNGLLHIPTGDLLPPTPAFFTRNALDFDYDPVAPQPRRWFAFLEQLWGTGNEIDVLQEIFGYLLVPDTSQQKIFMLVGPKRSGKGTIGRVLERLVGRANTCAPSLNTLSETFGLEPLIGKQLAVISDMRLSKRTDIAAIVENLLRISGEDMVSVNRKYKRAWNGRLAVRFMIISNELPGLADASGALANRLVPLVMHNSFFGQEDHGLLEGLLPELPGILCWAIEGWRRLQKHGHFVLPQNSSDAVQEIEDLASPVTTFLRECCEMDPNAAEPKDDVWLAWKHWCNQKEIRCGEPRHFGAKLLAAGSGRVRPCRKNICGKPIRHYSGLRLLSGAKPLTDEEIPF